MLFRLLGVVFVVGGCSGLGIWYREQLHGRLRAIRSLVKLLEMFMSEISFGKATLAESCKAVARRMEEPYKGVLEQIYWEYSANQTDSFRVILVRYMSGLFDMLPLKEEEKECFYSAFGDQGFPDGQMQLKCMEQSRKRLEDMIALQSQELKEKSRMAMGLGVMSGLLLVVIML